MSHLFDIIRDMINKRWTGTLNIRFYYGGIKSIDRSEPIKPKQDERIRKEETEEVSPR